MGEEPAWSFGEEARLKVSRRIIEEVGALGIICLAVCVWGGGGVKVR